VKCVAKPLKVKLLGSEIPFSVLTANANTLTIGA